MENLEKIKYHKTLAYFFESKPLYLDKPVEKKPNIRKLVEQPWQQTKAEMWDEAIGLLCNLDFIQVFALAKKMYELISDYDIVLDVLPENQENRSREKLYFDNLNTYFADYIKFLNKDITRLNTIESIALNFKISHSEDSFPDRIKMLKTFNRFVSSEIRLIIQYCSINSFIRQLAYNQNDRLLRDIAKPFRDDSVKSGNLFFKMDKILNNEISALVEHKFSIASKNQVDFGLLISTFNIDFTFNHIFIASGNLLQKWNTNTCLFEEEFLLCDNTITSLCLTTDLKRGIFLTSSTTEDNRVIIYDFEKLTQVLKISVDKEEPFIGISSDGHFCFTEFSDRILIWDIANKEVKSEIHPINKVYKSQRFFFINNSEYLLHDDSSISVRNIESGQLVFCYDKIIISNSKSFIRITPDVKYAFILTSSLIYKLDLEKRKISRKLNAPFQFSNFKITADGRYIYFIKNNKIFILDTILSKSPICVYNHIEEIVAFELSVNGRIGAILGAGEDYVSLINFEVQETLTDTKTLPFDAAFSKNTAHNEYILYAKDKVLTVVGNNKIIKKFEFSHYIADENFKYDISADGSHLVYAPAVSKAIIKDFSKNSIYETTVPNKSQITGLNISPNCRLLATADYGQTIIISDLKNGGHIKTICDFETHKAMSVCFSPSSRYLVTSAGNKIHIWNITNFELIKTVQAHKSWITSLFFSSDERILLSASEDREIKVWDFQSFQCVNILKTKGNNLKFSSVFQNKKLIVGNSIFTDDHSIVIDTSNFLRFPITTIMRTWKFVGNSEGYWDQSYSYACDYCESKIYDNEQIEKKLSEKYVKHNADNENSNEKKSNIIKCGKCGNYLILNDFIIN